MLRWLMSSGAVLPHRQCGTVSYQREQFQYEPTMASLRDFETEYLSSDPEVFVDFLSIKSLKKRYVESSNSENGAFCQWNHKLDDDFETFVQEFPIDDNISECFASSSDDTVKDLEGVVSEEDYDMAKKSKVKDARNKVSEAVNNIEKKLAENRKLKCGANFFRRKGKQNAMPKKSFSFDDLRTAGTGLDHAGPVGPKTPTRRCRALPRSTKQKVEPLPHCKLNSVVDSSLAMKTPKDPIKFCLRNEDPCEDHIDLRTIKARHLAPDKEPTGSLKLHRMSQSGIIRNRVLRKALRDPTKLKLSASSEHQVSSVCVSCRDLKLTQNGSTTAHSAAYMGHLQCLQALVESAADITAVNHDGMQPSQVALSTGHLDCWNYLTVAELSHVLLRELCNYGSIIERITTQLEAVRSEMVKVRNCLEKKSQDLNIQVKCLLEMTSTISRNLVTYPSNKQKCLGHTGSMYQDVQDSLTLLERIERKLNDLYNADCTGAGATGNDPLRGLETAIQKTEEHLLDDVHKNDIRQLENVQKRSRVIRNFLIGDEQRLRNNYAESVSSESMVSRGSRGRQTRAMVEPVLPSIASTSSSHFSSQERRKKLGKKKHHHHHHHHHRYKTEQNLSKLPPPAANPPTAVHAARSQRRRHRSQSASSRRSLLRSDTQSEGGRPRFLSSSSTGSSASFSCSDSDTVSSEWETTSQENSSTLKVNSEGSEVRRAQEKGSSRGASRGPPSCDWSFLRSTIQDERHKSQNRDSLSQSSLEVCIGYADRASSVGSLRRHRLANHFFHIEKDAKQKSGLVERVIKGEDERHDTASTSASAGSKRYCQDQGERTTSGCNVSCSQKDVKSGDVVFSSTSSSSPTSSRRTVIRNMATDEVNTTRLKPTPPINFSNTNTLREELIGRCRQVPMDIHKPAETFEDSFHEKPWYDVSDDETSVCTWTNEVPGYESESSFYQ